MSVIRFFAWLCHALAWKCDMDASLHVCGCKQVETPYAKCRRTRHHPGMHWNGGGELWREGEP